jgi:transposase
LKHEERIAMSKRTNAIAVSTIGIDRGKNTLHMIGVDEKGVVVVREKVSRSLIGH